VHWLTFDEPKSRLRRALKRSRFFQNFLCQTEKITSLSVQGRATRLAALAFTIADMQRFNPFCYKSIPDSLASIKPCPQIFFRTLLDRIHPRMSEFLKTEYDWGDEEITWAALSLEYVGSAIDSGGENNHNSGDSIAVLCAAADRIKGEISTATECSALVALATDCFNAELKKKIVTEPEFLPERLLLVEGQTESILLPIFAKLCGFDLFKNRVLVISGGGANQVAKRFLSFRQATSLSIACLLDADAKEQKDVIEQHLSDSDLLFSLSSGEFEDTYAINDFVELLNRYVQSMTGVNAPSLIEFQPILADQFESGQKRTPLLNRIWRSKSLGNFDKVEFAAFVAQNVQTQADIPEDFQKLIQLLKDRWGN